MQELPDQDALTHSLSATGPNVNLAREVRKKRSETPIDNSSSRASPCQSTFSLSRKSWLT